MAHIQDDGAQSYAITYDSWAEMLARAETTPDVSSAHSRTNAATMQWDLDAGWDGAVQFARAGWPDGATKARAQYDALWGRLSALIDVQEARHTHVPERWGILDIGAFCAGEPEHWLEFDEVRHAGEGTCYVKLAINVAASAGVAGPVMAARAVAIAALVDALELVGVRIEVTVMDVTHHGDVIASHGVIVKQYDTLLDLDRLVFAAGHPAMLRRIGFALMEQYPAWVRSKIGIGETFSGYGSPCDLAPNAQAAYDIYLKEMHAGDVTWASVDATLAWLRSTLESQGVIFRDP